MMKISYHKVLLDKKFSLKISRFVSASCYNVFVRVEKDDIVGWGESVPGETGAQNAEQIIFELEKLVETNINDKSISCLYIVKSTHITTLKLI